MKNDKGTKKSKVDKNKNTIFAVVAISSVVTVGALVTSKALWSQSSYYNKVADKKSVALKQLEENKKNIDKLTESYNKFNDEKVPNLLGGNPMGGDSVRDVPNSTLILDALPDKYDFPALVASLEKMLIGYRIDSIGGSDTSLSQSADTGAPVETPINFAVTTNYNGLTQLLSSFDRSIRPFHILKLDLSGANDALKISVDAKTYYQPETTVKITEEVVN